MEKITGNEYTDLEVYQKEIDTTDPSIQKIENDIKKLDEEKSNLVIPIDGVNKSVIDELQKRLEESPDALDAIICVAAASDFLLGNCIPVSDMEKAQKEGWIWVRQPKAEKTG